MLIRFGGHIICARCVGRVRAASVIYDAGGRGTISFDLSVIGVSLNISCRRVQRLLRTKSTHDNNPPTRGLLRLPGRNVRRHMCAQCAPSTPISATSHTPVYIRYDYDICCRAAPNLWVVCNKIAVNRRKD